ncbi:Lipopolysaccharide 1,2-glucosyltransferase [Budvicia aquatica]|uniref:Lipopolysaccharide 1,2-glucosyltransferase n=2 Tax=Budvicia aquatica TaxID=82979 RepID=A0A484ZSZ5_9GAMM|nr:Lipopolysaccharide 1,2-glucosyltransferase [Budvicia aquatica]
MIMIFFHIAFGVDESFIKPAGVTITSIIANNPEEFLHFHIFTSSILELDLTKIEEIKTNKIAITLYLVDSTAFSTFQVRENLPISVYYRMLSPEILKEVTDRVLYIDADILCLNSISNLKEIDFKDNIICAVNHQEFSASHINSLNLKNNNYYFNAGVMLINIPLWISNNIFDMFVNKITSQDFQYLDQDVLNILLEERVHYLSGKYNLFYSEKNTLLKDTIFMHFVGSPKPWKSWSPDITLYLNYYRKSPWADVELELPLNYKHKKLYAKKLWNDKKYYQSALWFSKYLINKLL